MKRYSIKANYKGLELNLGYVVTENDIETLIENIKNKHNVSEVIITEISYAKFEIEEVLPF